MNVCYVIKSASWVQACLLLLYMHHQSRLCTLYSSNSFCKKYYKTHTYITQVYIFLHHIAKNVDILLSRQSAWSVHNRTRSLGTFT